MERKDGANRGHRHPKSQRWFEISTDVNVRFKHYRVTHHGRVKIVSSLGARLLFAGFGPLSRACLSVISNPKESNPKALSSVWPSKILYRFLTVRFAQCFSFGIRHSFELIATERNAKVVPFRIETRAWPVVTWGKLNIAIPIKAKFTFWFYKGLCKQNMSLHGGVSNFTALTWKLDQSSRLEKQKQTKTLLTLIKSS